jgi:hypothetical protein
MVSRNRIVVKGLAILRGRKLLRCNRSSHRQEKYSGKKNRSYSPATRSLEFNANFHKSPRAAFIQGLFEFQWIHILFVSCEFVAGFRTSREVAFSPGACSS